MVSSNVGRLLSGSGPLRSLGAIARMQPAGRLFISTKNPEPPKPTERSKEQSQPLGPYYQTIHDSPTAYERKKPEEPPTTSTTAEASGAKRARKAKEDKVAPPPSPSASSPPPSSASPQPSATGTGTSKASAPPPSVESSPPAPTPPPSSAQQQAKVIFGSRLIGPAERQERLEAMRSRGKLVAGVLVPPRPEEPDNCCMSGCVNCVWDRYRDDMEEWAAASTEAQRRLTAQEAGAGGTSSAPAPAGDAGGVGARGSNHPAASIDDDGGGSETNWDVGRDPGTIAKDFWDERLYRNVPVGIREFMKQEKRLKEKHIREGSVGG